MTDATPSTMTAEVVQDSVNEAGERLTTVVMTVARSALAELNTHRVGSKSSASSRAIPVKRMLAAVERAPFIPRRFSRAQAGMATDSFIDYGSPEWDEAAQWWLESRDAAVKQVLRGLDLGLHKQDVNRLLEPFMLHTVVFSATEWANFIALRTALNEQGNPLAYPPIYDLAVATREALEASVPVPRPSSGDDAWHTPLVSAEERAVLGAEDSVRVSVARCARASYFQPDGRVSLADSGRAMEDEIALYERLLHPAVESAPHYSPFEHVAKAAPGLLSGNFVGWEQERKRIEKTSAAVL